MTKNYTFPKSIIILIAIIFGAGCFNATLETKVNKLQEYSKTNREAIRYLRKDLADLNSTMKTVVGEQKDLRQDFERSHHKFSKKFKDLQGNTTEVRIIKLSKSDRDLVNDLRVRNRVLARKVMGYAYEYHLGYRHYWNGNLTSAHAYFTKTINKLIRLRAIKGSWKPYCGNKSCKSYLAQALYYRARVYARRGNTSSAIADLLTMDQLGLMSSYKFWEDPVFKKIYAHHTFVLLWLKYNR